LQIVERKVFSLPRKPRIWYPGAIYHITLRGNRKSEIFYDNKDYVKYLGLIEETQQKLPFILHSYCLMPNHIHLQLETKETPLSDIMRVLNSRYAIYFNKKYKFIGHVFQDRYWARLILDDWYMLEASKYIHLNPVEANIVDSPEVYPWSSCAAYVDQTKMNPLISTEKILSFFSSPSNKNYMRYLKLEERNSELLTPLLAKNPFIKNFHINKL
jgi:putative transposase